MIAPQQQLATDPRHIRARFAGYCVETRLKIQPGDWIIYHPLTNDVYCAYSLSYQQFEAVNLYQLTP